MRTTVNAYDSQCIQQQEWLSMQMRGRLTDPPTPGPAPQQPHLAGEHPEPCLHAACYLCLHPTTKNRRKSPVPTEYQPALSYPLMGHCFALDTTEILQGVLWSGSNGFPLSGRLGLPGCNQAPAEQSAAT